MYYKGFKLDSFQEEAINFIEENLSVLISAPTGAGKTLIADYAVERTLKHGKRCIYTSPLKALSNQKYRDFIEYFGEENVGIMTGDVVINIESPLLIMTTEVLRNMLHRDIGRVSMVEYVVFDEMHFLANMERGTVWEECLILLPEHINIVGLSATVRNVDELARWLTEIKSKPVKCIIDYERPVPLKILGFSKETKLNTNEKIDAYRIRRLKKRFGFVPKIGQNKDIDLHRAADRKKMASIFQETNHRDVIRAIANDYLPSLYFVFSRQGCEKSANQLELDLTNQAEKKHIREIMKPILEKYSNYDATTRLCSLLERGIGYHHAGLFPFLKELVETLYEKKLIKVLFCTSTFALGVNMPAKTVVFDRLTKFDGKKIRPLTTMEFFQKAGRAGRRGMDKEGFVIINRNLRLDEGWRGYNEKDIQPILSALNLSYNSIINLLEKYSLKEIKTLLSNSLWTYQHRNKIDQNEEFLQFFMTDLEELHGFKINNNSEIVIQRKHELEKELKKTARKKAIIYGQIKGNKKKNLESELYRSLNKLEKKERDISDQKKNIDILGFILTPKEGNRRPGRKVKKLFSKVRRTQERIQYYRDFLFIVFQDKVRVLIDLKFISEDFQLLSRAELCKYLYIQELFVTLLIGSDVFSELDVLELNALLNCIGQSEKRKDRNKQISHPFNKKIIRLVKKYHSILRAAGADRFDPIEFNLQYAYVAYFWSKGYSFSEILSLTKLQEGDVISSFRQTIDLLKQLKDIYYSDSIMLDKIKTCIDCMDRDVVKVVI